MSRHITAKVLPCNHKNHSLERFAETTYTLIRSRRKTLAIHTKPDARNADGSIVEVRAQFRLAKSEIERFIASKSKWIAQKQAQIAATQPAQTAGAVTVTIYAG